MLVVKQSKVARIKVDGFRCERCGHEWVPRKKDVYPTVCPGCHNPYWDKAKQAKSTTEAGSDV